MAAVVVVGATLLGWPPGAAAVAGGASCAGVLASSAPSWATFGGLSAVAVGCLLAERWPGDLVGLVGGGLAAAGFAVLVVDAPEVVDAAWAPAVLLGAVPLAAAFAMVATRLGVRPALIAGLVAATGAWATLPDTEAPLGAGAGLAVAAVAAWVTVTVVASRSWWWRCLSWLPLASALSWAVVMGGRGRATGVVGGWACLATVAVLAVALAARPGRSIPLGWLVGIQAAAVVPAARVAGLATTVARATVVSAVVLVGAGLAFAGAAAFSRRAPSASPSAPR